MAIEHSRDELVRLTSSWTGERDQSGRPRVADSVLEQLRTITAEHAWHVLDESGYPYQFTGGWRSTNENRNLVGRAVTAQFLPYRRDFNEVVEAQGRSAGYAVGTQQNTWVVDSLQPNDVMVVDIFGKVLEGTVIGDNLGTSIAARTGAGAVIDGGVRDLNGLRKLDDASFFYRDTDPTPIKNVVLAGTNLAVRIGGVTVLPGDVVLGTESGVTFIPPQFAEEIVRAATEIGSRDEFGKQRLAEGRYTTAEIDSPTWSASIEADFAVWRTSTTAGRA
jgi:4-hydroxy-4-methyl-2-oxoglutarate aldolase